MGAEIGVEYRRKRSQNRGYPHAPSDVDVDNDRLVMAIPKVDSERGWWEGKKETVAGATRTIRRSVISAAMREQA